MGAQHIDKWALRQGNYRLEDSAAPNSSPPKLEDSLRVENPLAGILNRSSVDAGRYCSITSAGILPFHFSTSRAPCRESGTKRGLSEISDA